MKPATPTRLVVCSLTGIGLLFAGFAFAYFHYQPLPADDLTFLQITSLRRVQIGLSLPLLLMGFLIAILAERKIKRGIRANHWSPVELERARVLVNQPVLTWLVAAGFALFFITDIAMMLGTGHVPQAAGPAAFGFMLSLRKTLATPPTPAEPWTNLTPLHSAHWQQSTK